MARFLVEIIPPQQVSTAVAPLYVVPANRTTVVTRISFTNTTTTDRFVNVWLVPDGDSPADSNQFLKEAFVVAGETFSPSDIEGHNLPAGTSIQVTAEVNFALTIRGSGSEVTND